MRRLTSSISFSLHLVLAVSISLCLLILSVGVAGANGAPIKIVLTHLPGLSNWGPTDATGVAEVVEKEGEVNLSAVGLPALGDETYVGWLINTRNNQSISVGRFNSEQSETVSTQFILPTEIPDSGWNLFLVTVEAKGQDAASPGERKAIAGYFPDSAEAKKLPSQLPKTGGDADPGQPRGNQPAPVALPASQGNADPGNNMLTYGVILAAVAGVGLVTRMKMRR